MRNYSVTVFYEYPPVERSTVVVAENPQRAMVKSVLEGRVPALFRKDKFGWLEPVYWSPALAGKRRWPTVIATNAMTWGAAGDGVRLMFDVTAVEESESEVRPSHVTGL